MDLMWLNRFDSVKSHFLPNKINITKVLHAITLYSSHGSSCHVSMVTDSHKIGVIGLTADSYQSLINFSRSHTIYKNISR